VPNYTEGFQGQPGSTTWDQGPGSNISSGDGWSVFNPGGNSGNVILETDGGRVIGMPSLPRPGGGSRPINTSGVDWGGGVGGAPSVGVGGHVRDPRPDFGGGIFSGPGHVGPSPGFFETLMQTIAERLRRSDLGRIISETIENVPRDSNGEPILTNVPGVPDPAPGLPGSETDTGDVVDVPGSETDTFDPGAADPDGPTLRPEDSNIIDYPGPGDTTGEGTTGEGTTGDGTTGDGTGDTTGEGNEPKTPDPETTEPETGEKDVADFFDFGIGTPSEANQFSSSQSESSNVLLDPQRQLIESLLPQFQQLANQQGQQIGQIAPGLSSSLGARGGGFLDQLGQGSNQYLQQLAQFQGQNQAPQSAGGQQTFQQLSQGGGPLGQIAQGQNQFQQQLASSGPNEFLQPAIDNLGADINRQLQRQNVGIGQEASMAGARGGSRQGVAEGIAQEGALNAFTTQAGQLRAQDAAQQRQLQQSGQLGALQAQLQGGQLQQGGQLAGASGLQGGGQFNASLQQQAQQQGLQGLLGAAQGQNQLGASNQSGAGIGLGSLGGLFNLGLGQFGAQRSPFEALAGLFDPVNQAQSRSASSGASSQQGGFSFDLAI